MAKAMEGGTGFVDASSTLIRQGWTVENLLKDVAKSYWAAYTGPDGNSVVYQKNMTGITEGNLMNFEYRGNIVREMAMGREQLFGTGVEKKKFSAKLMIYDGRLSVDNGNRFKNKAIGDLSIGEHSDSIRELSDLWVRHKDQAIFDAAQGRLNSINNSHIFRPNDRATIGDLTPTDVMTYDYLLELEEKLEESDQFTIGDAKVPLNPFTTQNGDRVWMLMLDNSAYFDLRKDNRFQDLTVQADIRGINNFLFKGEIRRIGNLMITKAPIFFGTSSSRKIGKVAPRIAGFRKIDSSGKYTGEKEFGLPGNTIAARSLLLGGSAIQYGMGMNPDYGIKFSQDHDHTSESRLEVYFGVQKTQLIPESEDYEAAKVGNSDVGVVAVDTFVKVV